MLKPILWDPQKKLILPGSKEATLTFAVEHLIRAAKEAIADHGAFFIALSGGSTPKAIFQKLTSIPYQDQIAWEKVHIFFSDERSVPQDHPDSNYRMAMESGLKNMPLPPDQIHRMEAETSIDLNATRYETLIRSLLKEHPFDLIMLGMGEDGHTASLFPHTKALHTQGKLITANYVPQKETFRMTMTFECINQARQAVLYILGDSKAEILLEVLSEPHQEDLFPSQKVGTQERPALLILDDPAAALILPEIKKRQMEIGH